MKYDVFDIKFKVDSVKEFLRLKADSSLRIGYGTYAKRINVKRTTFISWVTKYKDNCLDYDDHNLDIVPISNDNNGFIDLSGDNLKLIDINKEIKDEPKMSLRINDCVIEFDPSYLKKIIETIKTC